MEGAARLLRRWCARVPRPRSRRLHRAIRIEDRFGRTGGLGRVDRTVPRPARDARRGARRHAAASPRREGGDPLPRGRQRAARFRRLLQPRQRLLRLSRSGGHLPPRALRQQRDLRRRPWRRPWRRTRWSRRSRRSSARFRSRRPRRVPRARRPRRASARFRPRWPTARIRRGRIASGARRVRSRWWPGTWCPRWPGFPPR